MIKIGINGFGRIGRIAARIALETKDVQLTAINSRADAESHAYLLKYDSVQGTFSQDIQAKSNEMFVDNKKIVCFREEEPGKISWQDLDIDIVLESTGIFKKRAQAEKHLGGSVKKVIISAPSDDADKMFVMGLNEKLYQPDEDHVVSNASCTTNCLAVMSKVVNDEFGILSGAAVTIHAPTLTQALLDKSHKKDKRRGRAAFLNIIPTTTGSAKCLQYILPELKGKISSSALRVPVGDGSIVLLDALTEKSAREEDIHRAFKKSAQDLGSVLEIAPEGTVSQDIIGNQASAIYDPSCTVALKNNLISISAWYDNEAGYAARLIDLAKYIGSFF